ncbi:response regulator, partial [Candidatus Wolfebacteria bacterium]
LIVDDDTFLLDMYSVKFKEKGFDVSLALSSRDALVMLEEGLEPSVIALDIVMPTMDGLELLEKIVKDGLAKDSVIVMLTNQSSQPNIDRALELGAKDYIVKASAIPSEVYEKIKTLLDKYKK